MKSKKDQIALTRDDDTNDVYSQSFLVENHSRGSLGPDDTNVTSMKGIIMTTEIEELEAALDAAHDDIELWKQRSRLWESRAKRNANKLSKIHDIIDPEIYV